MAGQNTRITMLEIATVFGTGAESHSGRHPVWDDAKSKLSGAPQLPEQNQSYLPGG